MPRGVTVATRISSQSKELLQRLAIQENRSMADIMAELIEARLIEAFPSRPTIRLPGEQPLPFEEKE